MRTSILTNRLIPAGIVSALAAGTLLLAGFANPDPTVLSADPEALSYQSAEIYGGGATFYADKTTSAEAANDVYRFNLEIICNPGHEGKWIYVTLKYDTGSGFNTYNTYGIPLDSTGCDFPDDTGWWELSMIQDGLGAGTQFKLEVYAPGGGFFDFVPYGPTYVDWND